MAGRPARLVVDIVADARGVAKGTREAEGSFKRLGGSLRKFGGVHAMVMGAATGAVGALVWSAVKAASDVEQSMGAVETIFGKSAKTVKRYADTSAERLGLARSEYAMLAAGVGTSMKSMGKSQKESAKLTDKLITRAADLAATFGGTTTEAVQALGSALRGEAEPARRLGVNISATRVQSILAAKGQDKLTGAALENAKQQAILGLVMDQSKDKAGAFARESNTLAGTQERLRAKFTNTKAELGQKLLPMLTRMGQWMLRNGVPAMEKMGRWASEHLVPALRKLRDYVMNRIMPVFREQLQPRIDGIKRGFEHIAREVRENRDSFEKLKPALEKIGKKLLEVAPSAKTVGRAFEAVGYAIGRTLDILAAFIDFTDRAIRKFKEFRDIASAVPGVLRNIPGFSLDVTTMTPGALVGPAQRMGPGLGNLATASAVDALASWSPARLARTQTPARPATVVNMPITINGALDPVAVARQLDRILKDASVRLGRAPALSW